LKLFILKLLKNNRSKILSLFFFVILSGAYLNTFAAFAPGQTLNPDCAPGELDCIVSFSSTTSEIFTNKNLTSTTNVFPIFDQNTTGTSSGIASVYTDWNSLSGGNSILNKPTNLSFFINDLGNYGGFLTSFTETDPTIFPWAKANSKPTYTAVEVGAPSGSGTSFGTNTGDQTLASLGAAPSFSSGTANYFWATPNGTTGVPSLRAIVAADIPTLNQNTTGNAATATNLTGLTATIANLNTVTGALGSNAFTSTAYLPTASFTDAAVTGKVITGYVSGAGTVASTDTILQALNKLSGNDALKANIASPTFTGTVNGITATMVGAPSGSGTSSGANTGDNSANTTYSNDYRAANFVAGTNYLAPNGSAAALTSFPTFNQNTTGTAGNITGGLGGQILYQSAVNATAKLANGSAGQILSSQGTTLAPQWSNQNITIINTTNLFSNLTGTGSGVTTTSNSNFLGSYAGSSATSASDSNFLGFNAGRNATNASSSNFLGASAGYSATSASSSNFIGPGSGYLSNLANNSNFIGNSTGSYAANASYSNFIGDNAGGDATNASYSNFIGSYTGNGSNAASYSNIFGFHAGKYYAGNNIGSNNIIIGTNVSLPNTITNSMNLGGVLFATGMQSDNSATNPYITAMSGGKVGIGIVSPTARLQLPAGSATAGTAPLKLTSGTNLGTTEAGAMEWDGTNLYVTQTSGPTRKTIAYSGDILPPAGTNWISQTAASADSWQAIAYGNGLYVAVSANGKCMTSPNGVKWTLRTITGATQLASIAYGNGIFVAIGGYGTANIVFTSSDGVTWTAQTAASSRQWVSVIYSNGYFIAGGNAGAPNYQTIMTSTNGTSWTTQSVGNNGGYNARSIAYGNGTFVAISDAAGLVATATDPNSWTLQSSISEWNLWYSVAYGNGIFVAVSGNGTHRVATSPDGVTWTLQTAAAQNQWYSVAYGNGLFVAVSYDGTNRVMTSPDGETWTLQTSSTVDTWQGITYGNGLFVAVGGGYTNGVNVMTSGVKEITINPSYNVFQDISSSDLGREVQVL
jgi:hypothetical protein